MRTLQPMLQGRISGDHVPVRHMRQSSLDLFKAARGAMPSFEMRLGIVAVDDSRQPKCCGAICKTHAAEPEAHCNSSRCNSRLSGSVLTAGRPRSCTPRDRFCGPYNIAIAIVIAIVIVASAVPRGVGADGRAAAVLYPEGSVLRALHYRHRHHGRCCTPRDRC